MEAAQTASSPVQQCTWPVTERAGEGAGKARSVIGATARRRGIEGLACLSLAAIRQRRAAVWASDGAGSRGRPMEGPRKGSECTRTYHTVMGCARGLRAGNTLDCGHRHFTCGIVWVTLGHDHERGAAQRGACGAGITRHPPLSATFAGPSAIAAWGQQGAGEPLGLELFSALLVHTGTSRGWCVHQENC
jgi:hypothetical protein